MRFSDAESNLMASLQPHPRFPRKLCKCVCETIKMIRGSSRRIDGGARSQTRRIHSRPWRILTKDGAPNKRRRNFYSSYFAARRGAGRRAPGSERYTTGTEHLTRSRPRTQRRHWSVARTRPGAWTPRRDAVPPSLSSSENKTRVFIARPG